MTPPKMACGKSVMRCESGGGGWGNFEAQVYTADRANSRLDAKGRLIIEARRSGTTITSARLTTRGKFSFTYGVRRAPGAITMTIDGKVVSVYRPATLHAGTRWVFDRPMYVLLNLAAGGIWPGPVSPSTQFPARMVVDWVRYHP